MKTAAVYRRRSRKEKETEKRTGKKVHSLDLQLAWAERLADDDGFKRVIPYTDEASGKDLARRPDLQRLFKDIGSQKKKIERVYCYAVDRLSRNVEVMERLVPFLEVYDVDIVFGDLLDTVGPNMRLLLSVLSAIAEMQLKETQRKVKAGLEMALEEGKLIGRPPTGFHISDDGKDWLPYSWLVEAVKLRNEGVSLIDMRDTLKIPISRIPRGLVRYDAWELGGVKALRRFVRSESDAAMARMSIAVKKRKAEEEAFLAWVQKRVAEYRIQKAGVRRKYD